MSLCSHLKLLMDFIVLYPNLSTLLLHTFNLLSFHTDAALQLLDPTIVWSCQLLFLLGVLRLHLLQDAFPLVDVVGMGLFFFL